MCVSACEQSKDFFLKMEAVQEENVYVHAVCKVYGIFMCIFCVCVPVYLAVLVISRPAVLYFPVILVQ